MKRISSSSFAENPGLSSPEMNAPVAAAATVAPKGFLLRRIPPIDEWRLRAWFDKLTIPRMDSTTLTIRPEPAEGRTIPSEVEGLARRASFAIIFLVIAGFLASPAFAKEVKFEVNLDRSRIGIGETSQLGLSFYGTQSMPAPDLGSVEGLEIRYIGPSTMMTVINGQVSSSITHMYSVLPLRTGKFQLGPYTFRYKSDSYTSNIVFLEATEERAMPIRAPGTAAGQAEKLDLENRIFATLTVGNIEAYVNELIPITVKLYVNRLNVSDIQLPTLLQEDFSKIEFKEPKQYRERLNGQIYDVLEFKTSIFGTKPGDYRVGPAKIKCSVMVRKRVPAAPSVKDEFYEDQNYRDSFFDDFFTRYERHPLELQSGDARLVILPLPSQGRPADFTGAVGDYQFIYNGGPAKVKVGDPITVRMDINGTGNFNTVLVPKLEDLAGFRVYEPQVKTDDNHKAFAQVLIPESDQVTQIPKATFTFFDPVKKEYRTITQGPIKIQVEKGKDEGPSQVIGPVDGPTSGSESSAKDEALARDIIYVKESPGPWLRKGQAFFKSKLFYCLWIIPLLFLIALSIFIQRQNRLKSDTAYAGRILAFKASRNGIKDLMHKLKAGDSKVFYETLFKTLQDYLGYRLQLPPAGITFDEVRIVLASKGVDLELLRKIRSLFDICDKARFAYMEVKDFKMHDDLKELEEVFSYLEHKRI